MTEPFRQPASGFYPVVHLPARKPVFKARFARPELGEHAAQGSSEGIPVLERPMGRLSCTGIAI
jgi:hypothetical protein